jgi:LETM1 and EF-hand domain-containing protein 1
VLPAAACCPALRQVRAGAEVSNAELVKFASLFNDELTLDNLDRVQLVSMCQLLNIPPFGTDGFLKNRLRSNLDAIKQVGLNVSCSMPH